MWHKGKRLVYTARQGNTCKLNEKIDRQSPHRYCCSVFFCNFFIRKLFKGLPPGDFGSRQSLTFLGPTLGTFTFDLPLDPPIPLLLSRHDGHKYMKIGHQCRYPLLASQQEDFWQQCRKHEQIYSFCRHGGLKVGPMSMSPWSQGALSTCFTQ